MRKNTKMLAILSVFAMLMVGAVPLFEMESADATVGDGGAYSYTLVYNSAQMGNTAAQETQLTVDGMTPISHSSGTTTMTALANYGSWTWDYNATTHEGSGLGPFNSFYAAFDADNGNTFVARLNPYNLGQDLTGTALPSGHNYNIMWVLPTVYWSVDGSGNVTLTNDSTSGGTAYAHTIDGHVYKYVAYGVYHAYKRTLSTGPDNGKIVLTSEPGVAPTVSQTRATFRDQANNYTMDSSLGTNAYSMLWNFYQWELYKLCAYTVMEGFNSQAIVGNGNVYGGNYTKVTGGTATMGPYVGNTGNLGSDGANAATYGQDYAKLFIEEAWGTVRDFVDGVVCASSGYYIDSSHIPTDSTTVSGYVENVAVAIPSYNFGSAISTNAKVWGMATATSGSWNVGTTDKMGGASSNNVLCVGGFSSAGASTSVYCGLSFAIASNALSYSYSNIGSRLAFVFDADPASPTYTATITVDNPTYGTVSGNEVTAIEPGTSITVSTNTLTIGSTTITATPTTATTQYTYAFAGWYDGDTQLQTGDTITDDITITAKFTRTVNNYDITFVAGDYGTVSANSIASVPYDSAISINNTAMTITINGSTITATPTTDTAQYDYGFDGWYVGDVKLTSSSKTTDGMTITAKFTRAIQTYTVHFVINGSTTNRTYDYGTTPEQMTDIPTPTKNHYDFVEWNPELATVTGEATYTAVFTPTVYTVTWNANGGTVSPTTSTGTVETAVVIPDDPTLDYNTFIGWYTQATGGSEISTPYYPQSDVELYAHWNAIVYTVTFDATTNGGTTEATQITGKNSTGVELPEATKDGMYFDGWWTDATDGTRVGFAGDIYHPTADITLYAKFTDSPLYTYSVNFDLDGGYGSVSTLTYTSDTATAYDFTIPDVTPAKYLLEFLGWAEEKGASEPDYVAGDTVTVSPNESVTLYAVWFPTEEHNQFKNLIDTIPLLMVIGLILGIVGVLFNSYRNGGLDPKTLVMVSIGAAISILVIATMIIPIFAGL